MEVFGLIKNTSPVSLSESELFFIHFLKSSISSNSCLSSFVSCIDSLTPASLSVLETKDALDKGLKGKAIGDYIKDKEKELFTSS